LDFSPGISYFFGQLSKAFLSPGSHISLLSLFSALGVAVMSVFVVVMNRLLWRPLYAFAERRTRLD